MTSGRLEAFSDGVIAILITIMVLELRVPEEATWEALKPLRSVLLSYLLSFVYLGIYWSNHHHLFQVVERVNGKMLWANLHLLFWLSLVPFTTRWLGEASVSEVPVAVYGIVLLLAALAYSILTVAILAEHGHESLIAHMLGRDIKGKVSLLLYSTAIPLAFVQPWIAIGIYIIVALMWLTPDRRIEGELAEHAGDGAGTGGHASKQP